MPGGTLRVGVEADTNGWVPAIMQCDSACQIRAKTMFETVTSGDPEGKSHPYLAESIEPNDDYTVWTIKVRPGITFHDGEKLDAAAMVEEPVAQRRHGVRRFGGRQHRGRWPGQSRGRRGDQGHRRHDRRGPR